MSEGTWKESISLEETNKIRISLGLKPISEGPSAAKTKESEAADNFAARQEADRAARESTALQSRIDKARNAKERVKKLTGRSLGAEDDEVKAEADDGGAGAKAWVKQQKRRAKELAAKRLRDEEETERLLQEQGRTAYGEKDLEGLKVLHGGDDFEEGEETVLTLRDSKILDDEDDELHNINISENTKTADALALKRKGRQAGQYTGYDDDEFTEAGKAGVLSKYDDEITGKADDGGFRLGGAMPPPKKSGKAAKDDPEEERERVKLTMDYTKSFDNDYLKEGEAGFKIKKKKKRPTATRVAASSLDDRSGDGMELDGAPGPSRIERQNLDEANLIDDDDLQASLARARREQNRKKVLAIKANAAKIGTANGTGTGMELDGSPAIKREEEDPAFSERTGGEDDVLVLDDTSEFVRTIQLAAARPPPKLKRAHSPAPPVSASNGAESVMKAVKAEEEDVPISEMITSTEQPREEGEEMEDAPMAEGERLMGSDEEELKPKAESDDDFGGTAGEKLVSGGMAATLALLKSQGLIKPKTPEELERIRAQKEREAWLAEQRARDREREEERQRSRAAGASIDQSQREYENRMREQREAQNALKAFENYKPVVNITYHDEFGRDQTPKEAYKQLSHTFHGKGSGAKKTEKRLKRIEDEQKQMRMQSGDTPLATAAAFSARAERMGSATMILSVGNKGTAPLQDEILNTAKKTDKGKGKQKAAQRDEPTVFGDIPMRPLPLPVPTNGNGERTSASPAPRAGFQPVRSFTPIGQGASDEGGSREGTPGGMGKVFIPVAVKRKAEGDLGGQSSKR